MGPEPSCKLQQGHCVLITLDQHRLALKTQHSHCLVVLQGYEAEEDAWYPRPCVFDLRLRCVRVTDWPIGQ